LTVVLENVHDPHNIGAVLRSCDAVGVLEVHTVYSVEERPTRAYARSSSGSASKWIEIHHHDSITACFQVLRARNFKIFAAALSETAIDLYDLELTEPMALVFGNEQRGISAEAIAQADQYVSLPMMGMVESLNISVACAVSLFEAMRQRRAAGLYEAPRLDQQRVEALRAEWLTR
jgi:tRNA (guanosine-2'-O-)-methyltransferase